MARAPEEATRLSVAVLIRPVGLNNLGLGTGPAFGMIVVVLFSAVYAALRAVLGLVVLRGREGC